MPSPFVRARGRQAETPRARPTPRRSCVPLLEALEDRFLLATYYVSPTGNDSNNGTAPGAAWQTINKVNQQTFAAGDVIRFQGGATFPGNLLFSNEAGTPTSPIIINSYGTGRATIQAGTSYGIYLQNKGGFRINNLNFVGGGMHVNASSGILLYNDLPGNVELQHFRVNNVDVSQFGQFGINVLGCNSASGFNDIRITYARLHHNLHAGLSTTGPFYCYFSEPTRSDVRVIRNLYVGHVDTFNNPGLPPSQQYSSGSGIILSSVNTGTVERCLAYDNGGVGTGNVGIWAYNSNNVVIQYNESYRNRTGGDAEGGGFDLDFDTTDSILQYNYSHDNDGQGLYLVGIGPNDPIFNPPPGPGDLSNTGNVIRYNISERDARKNLAGGITLYGAVRNAQIYNNTVFLTPNSTQGASAVLFGNFYGDNVNFRNNILYTTGGAWLITAAGILTATNVRFQGNDYWTAGAAFIIYYGGTVYTSLAAWRGAGQEMVGVNPVGMNVNPGLTNPGGGGTIGNADQLHTLTAYRLLSTSPLKNAGLNLRLLFDINPGPRDFYGNPIPLGPGFSIGAHEAP